MKSTTLNPFRIGLVAGLLAAFTASCVPVMHEYKGHHVFNPVFLFYLESAERDGWQKPDQVIQALGLPPGASVADIEIINLSITGFMAHGDVGLETGSHAWLKLPGLEPQNCTLVWVKDGKAGFEFTNPLHPAQIELLVSTGRRPIPRGHFGPQSGR